MALVAFTPEASAQGSQLFPWELEADVETPTKLTIYDGEGDLLYSTTISDTLSWKADLDTPPTGCSGACDWSFEWEAETDTEVLFFRFQLSSTNEWIGTYAYVPATDRDGTGTFYLPWGIIETGNWDTYFEVVYENGEYAGTDHALFGWVALFGLAVEVGDVARAEAALAATEGSWPETEATAMLRREHTLRLGVDGRGEARGTVAGRSGGASGVDAQSARGTAAAEFALYSAYPNPSSGAVTVPLMVPEAAEVSVAVFDVLGRRVAVLADGRMEAGRRELTMEARALPAGLYVVRVTVRTDSGVERAFSRRVSVVR